MDSSNSSESDKYDYVRFIKFLNSNNILSLAVSAVLSSHISKIGKAFVEDFILPVFNKDGDSDGEKDIKPLQDKIVSYRGIQFKVGDFFITVLEFIIISYIVFLISVYGKNIQVVK